MGMRNLIMAALLGFLATPAAAQTGVMTNWSFAEMRIVLAEMKAEVTKDGVTEDGLRYLEAKADTGMVFAVYGMECDSKEATQRCLGADMVASFTLKPGMMDEALEVIDYAAISTYDGGGDKVKISRYVIFDSGILRENLKANLRVFLNLGDDVWDDLDSADMLR